MSTMESFGELSISILKACGIPHENVTGVWYSHEVGGVPRIDVSYISKATGETIVEIYGPFEKKWGKSA